VGIGVNDAAARKLRATGLAQRVYANARITKLRNMPIGGRLSQFLVLTFKRHRSLSRL